MWGYAEGMTKREGTFKFRVGDHERRMLADLAEPPQRTQSDALRWLIRNYSPAQQGPARLNDETLAGDAMSRALVLPDPSGPSGGECVA